MPKTFKCSICDTEYGTEEEAKACESLEQLGESYRIGERGDRVVSIRSQVIHTLKHRSYKLISTGNRRYHMCMYEVDPPAFYRGKESKIISGRALEENFYIYKEKVS